jgi:predicted ArsR family transcriptional regulator
MSTPSTPSGEWDVAQVLAEPTRRMIFDAVRQARAPLSRDDVARVTGVNRRLATFHLDRLTEAGLLCTDYSRPAGRRGGPGAGRPAKRYTAADVELDLTVPPRHYVFAARLLAQAINKRPKDAVTGSFEVARTEGKRIGVLRRPHGRPGAQRRRAVALDTLEALGYEPAVETSAAASADVVRLRNCPFRSVADIAPELVCGMNHELVTGVFEGLEQDSVRVALEPNPPNCCLTVTLPR